MHKKKIPHVSKHLLYISGIVFFAVLVFVGLFGYVFANDAHQFKASGYAFGSIDDNNDQVGTGFGYVGFGCETDPGSTCENTATDLFPSGYGVRINTDPDSADYGKFFGHAWSTYYGWISFYHNDVASCGPAGGVEIPGDITSFLNTPGEVVTLDGFARVLNYNQPDWNGCIRFASNDHFGVGSTYESRLRMQSTEEIALEGFAWGNNLTGWLSFECADCDVVFTPLPEEECEEADDSEECAPEEEEEEIGVDLELYIEVIGSSYYDLLIDDENANYDVSLFPQAFGEDVESCTASFDTNSNGVVSGWGGALNDPGMSPLVVGDVSQEFSVALSNLSIGEVISFTLDCVSTTLGVPVSGEAFLTVDFPPGSVSINANPSVIDDQSGISELSWTFENVNENSCQIVGYVDTTPGIGDDDPIPMSSGFADSIGFNSLSWSGPDNAPVWETDTPGNDDLFGISLFPIAFVLSCEDFGGVTLSDIAYITTQELGCTESMELAGYCSNNINPIFEEF